MIGPVMADEGRKNCKEGAWNLDLDLALLNKQHGQNQ
jgi:hypothetical protein